MNYCLQNDVLTVTLDSLGGQLTSIKSKNDLEYLWQGDVAYWSGQAPILFPICGSLRDNKAFNQAGETIEMPRHGLIRKCEFTCVKETSSEIVFAIQSDDAMKAAYPYEFTFYVSYHLVGDTILVQYIVQNQSDCDLPFFVGGHPGFNCPLEEGLEFTDYQIRFEKEEETNLVRPILENGLIDRENLRSLDFDGKTLALDHDHFREDALCFKDARSRSVSLCSDKGKHSVTLAFDDYPNVLIWSSPNDGPFFALEPMLGLSTFLDEGDQFEEKDQVQILPAGQVGCYSYRLIFQ